VALLLRLPARRVAVDDDGVRDLRTGLRIRWDEITTLRFAAHPHEMGAEVALLRYAVVEGEGDRAIAFCDKGRSRARPCARPTGRSPTWPRAAC